MFVTNTDTIIIWIGTRNRDCVERPYGTKELNRDCV